MHDKGKRQAVLFVFVRSIHDLLLSCVYLSKDRWTIFSPTSVLVRPSMRRTFATVAGLFNYGLNKTGV